MEQNVYIITCKAAVCQNLPLKCFLYILTGNYNCLMSTYISVPVSL